MSWLGDVKIENNGKFARSNTRAHYILDISLLSAYNEPKGISIIIINSFGT